MRSSGGYDDGLYCFFRLSPLQLKFLKSLNQRKNMPHALKRELDAHAAGAADSGSSEDEAGGKTKLVRTRMDRLFAKKNQGVLSETYRSLHDDADSDKPSDDDDDLLIKACLLRPTAICANPASLCTRLTCSSPCRQRCTILFLALLAVGPQVLVGNAVRYGATHRPAPAGHLSIGTVACGVWRRWVRSTRRMQWRQPTALPPIVASSSRRSQ
jgi:hypothetical protein